MISRVSARGRSLHTLNSKFHPSRNQNSISTPTPLENNPILTPLTVLDTLYSYSNDWQRALEFFNWVETQPGFQHTTQTYNRIIDILGKFFEFHTCWDMVSRMSKHDLSSPDHLTFRVIFKRYVCARLPHEAIQIFHSRLDEFGFKDHASFINLVDALCEYKHVVEAEEICFNDRDRIVEDTKIYNMILRGWHKVGRWGKCYDFWEEMDMKGVRKDLFSYSIYMDILCKSGKAWKAKKIYKEMKRKRIKLDVAAYNTLIRAVGISDGVDSAVGVLREMIESKCEPNVVTYNIILRLYCENWRYRDMYNMLNEMRNKGCDPNVITFHGIFASMQKPKELMQLFERMIENGIQPQMDTYVMLMKKFGRWGFLRLVLNVWKKMEEHGLSPDAGAYNALIDALVQKGLIDMARTYDQEMYKKGLSPKPRAELENKPATVTGSSTAF